MNWYPWAGFFITLIVLLYSAYKWGRRQERLRIQNETRHVEKQIREIVESVDVPDDEDELDRLI